MRVLIPVYTGYNSILLSKLYEADHILVSQGRRLEPVTARFASCCSRAINEIKLKDYAMMAQSPGSCAAPPVSSDDPPLMPDAGVVTKPGFGLSAGAATKPILA